MTRKRHRCGNAAQDAEHDETGVLRRGGHRASLEAIAQGPCRTKLRRGKRSGAPAHQFPRQHRARLFHSMATHSARSRPWTKSRLSFDCLSHPAGLAAPRLSTSAWQAHTQHCSVKTGMNPSHIDSSGPKHAARHLGRTYSNNRGAPDAVSSTKRRRNARWAHSPTPTTASNAAARSPRSGSSKAETQRHHAHIQKQQNEL